jgi:hypothetical protein
MESETDFNWTESSPNDEYFDRNVEMGDFLLERMKVFMCVYMLLAVLGVLLNLLVLIRLLAQWLRQSDRFFDGCAMPLSLMALADLFTLISIVTLVQFSFILSPEQTHPDGPSAFSCKVGSNRQVQGASEVPGFSV